MNRRVLFQLTMPGVGSWNGKWSGEGRNYSVVRSLPESRIAELDLPRSFTHSWSDGWRANIAVRVVRAGERPKISKDFCGYEWMVQNIITYGATNSCPPHAWEADTSYVGFERCPKCRTSRKLSVSAGAP